MIAFSVVGAIMHYIHINIIKFWYLSSQQKNKTGKKMQQWPMQRPAGFPLFLGFFYTSIASTSYFSFCENKKDSFNRMHVSKFGCFTTSTSHHWVPYPVTWPSVTTQQKLNASSEECLFKYIMSGSTDMFLVDLRRTEKQWQSKQLFFLQ